MNASTVNLLLIGPRAAGKTTVARILAQRLGRSMIDLDDLTLQAFADSTSVAQAWRQHGELSWRAAEVAALDQALNQQGRVIALGGGTPMLPGAQLRLRRAHDAGHTLVMYLRATPEALKRRLMAEAGDRPPLRSGNAVEEVEIILREREPTYLKCSDLVIDADQPAQMVVESIVESLRDR